MSKDQVGKCGSADSDTMMSEQQSAVLNPETTVVIVDDVDDDSDGDEDEDDVQSAATMQFATERIVKYFSRCMSATSPGEIFCLLLLSSVE